jgi:hypothetical protein
MIWAPLRRRLPLGLALIALAIGVAILLPALGYLSDYPARRVAPLATQVALAPFAPGTPIIAGATPAPLEAKDRLALQRDLLQYETDSQIKIWTTIVQAVGGAVVLVGIWFTWRNLRVAQEGQITNRFTQAIDQLGAELKDGKPNLEVRLGGIYALERIARDSPKDHWSIMEVLLTYVRENAPSHEGAYADNISAPEMPLEAVHERPSRPKPRADTFRPS